MNCEKCIHDDVCMYDGNKTYCSSYEEKRPQGKWNMDKCDRAFLAVRECLNCNNRSAVGNYCMWCGADMREGEEE